MDNIVIAIDPGPKESAIVAWDGNEVLNRKIVENESLLEFLKSNSSIHPLVVERVACYGMPIGDTVFETVFWTGRFCQAWPGDHYRVKRLDIKMHICHDSRAKDSNIIQALVDRFAYGQKNRGKGTKASPGFFYGFKADIWQAFALAVYWIDTTRREP